MQDTDPDLCHRIDAIVLQWIYGTISNQLFNVDAPVTNDKLVLQLVVGLIDAYTHVGTQIRYSDSLPMFYKARSMLILKEIANSKGSN